MKVLAVLLALACTALYVQAQNVICGKGTTSKTVTVEDKKSYTFKTQRGKKYKGNTDCTGEYVMGDTCAKMLFSCTKFNTNNKDKKKCAKGDKVTVTANGKSKAYCKTKKPKVTSTGDITVVFTSDKKKSGTGAVCKVKCTEAATETTTSGGGTEETEDILWVGPGDGSRSKSEVFSLPSLTASTCRVPKHPLKTLSGSFASIINGVLMVCGGYTDLGYGLRTSTATSGDQKRCHSLINRKWEKAPSMKKARFAESAAAKISEGWWITGGYSRLSTEILRNGKSRWEKSTNLPKEIVYHCIVALNETHTMLIGGLDGYYDVISKTFLYHNGTFTAAADLNQARYRQSCTLYKGEVYVAGGKDENNDFLDTVEIYNPTDGTWRYGPSLPRKTSSAEMVVFENTLLCIGGFRSKNIYKFDGISWTLAAKLKQQLDDFPAVICKRSVLGC